MNDSTIRTLTIVLVIVFVKVIINNIKNFKKKSISKLSSEELEYNEILDFITDLCINFDDNNRDNYTNQQLVVISAMEYYDEVMNGGLCQFFANSSRVFTPILSASLEQLNAKKHKDHFDNFIEQNKIDVNDLNDFESEDVDEFLNKYDTYSFDDFDKKFYEIDKTEKLCDLIIEYARNNFDVIFYDIKK